MTWSRFKYGMLVKVRPRVGFNIAGWSKYDLEYSRLVKIRPGVGISITVWSKYDLG